MFILRFVAYLLLTLVSISILQSIFAMLMRMFGIPARAQKLREVKQDRETIRLAGELKKDPVCGTYTTADTAVQKKVRGETFYFCSTQCRDKFVARA